MTVTVRHLKVSAIPDDSAAADAGEVLPSDWNAGHVVEIDALDGVPIGATTPAAGTFTTLTATGNINLTQSTTTVNTPSGTILSFVDGGLSPNTGAYLQLGNSATSASTQRAAGANTNISIYWLSKGTGFHSFNTNNATGTQQMVVSHTASAVNYVQVTGAATGGRPTISAQGSDTNVGLTFISKGSSRTAAFFNNNAASSFQFSIGLAGTTNAVNYLNANGVAASSSPELTAEGTDTNLDIRFTPKGTGNVRFGTFTSNADTAVTGYITIKDSGGTVRKLAVIA